jgi:Tol biopolymer transport system component
MKSIRLTLGAGAILALSLAGSADAQKPQPAHQTPNQQTVIVASVGFDADSIRTIMQRDFDYGDRISPIVVDPSYSASLVSSGIPNYAALAKLKARSVVIPRVEPTGVRVAYYDVRNSRLVQESFFSLTAVPALRGMELRDSVLRSYATKDSLSQIALARVALVRDSLLLAARAKPDRDKKKQALIQAQRDSLVASLLAEETGLVAQRARDFVERDSTIPVVVRRDSIARDSLAYMHRMAIHAISDEVTRWITGQRGYAQSRVVYVQNGTLRVVDSDGANDRRLTDSGLALSPSWHPDGNRVVFSHFTRAGTQIAQVDVWSGRVTMVDATPRGLNMTPAYTPDGRHIIYSTAARGTTGLVVADADSATPARPLTFSGQETSSPTFSPEGRLAYISPRPWQGTGPNARFTPQIFVMNPDGTESQLTPTRPGVRSYRTSPDWSPDGKRVAFMQQQGDFQLWTIDVRTKNMKQITSAGSENEDPTWSPDSRHLAFTSNRGGSKEIWVMDVQSGRLRQLTHQGGGARLAAWSKTYDPTMVAARSTPVSAPVTTIQQQH